MKKSLIVVATSSLFVVGLGLVGAQSAQSQSAQSQNAPQPLNDFRHGFSHSFGQGNDLGHGFGGLPFGHHLALGTTVTLEFYTGDPSTDTNASTSTQTGSESGGAGEAQQTLTFTYGEDSEAAFAETFAAARADADYMVVSVGEQTQTLELPSASDQTSDGTQPRRGGFGSGFGALPLHGLNEGSSVTATFYDGDPAANAQELQTLSFTYGQDSEAGFADQFASAAQGAAYVTVTTSPQTYTVNLSDVPDRESPREHGGFDGFRGSFRGDSRQEGPAGPGHRR